MKKKSKECQSRWFTFVLYPQNGAHMDILNFLLDEKVQEKQEFKVAGMMHDRCYYTEGLKKGFPKKPHIHVIMKTERKHTGTAIAKMMGGQRAVLRLYQRDEKHEHSTNLIIPKGKEEEETKEQSEKDSSKEQSEKDSPISGQQELPTGQPEQNSSILLNSKEPQQDKNQPEQDSSKNQEPQQDKNQPEQDSSKNLKIVGGITRTFHHETGEEHPVLVDMGYDELQPIDIEIPPEIWAVMESKDGHHWDSLPQCFYNNPMYPQFRCADNQYWKLITRQDLAHAEIISDPKAYYLYLQHKDIASVRNQKTPYDEKEFFGNQELLAELRGERGKMYQVTQVIEYFEACGVTNGKQAYKALLYGDHTEELFNFYWNNTSKFTSYFRGCELESMNQIKEDEKKNEVSDSSDKPIDYNHKRKRELKEHIQECDKKTAKYLSGKYESIIEAGKNTGNLNEAQQKELKDIADWFSCHPTQKLFDYVPYEEQLFRIQLYNDIMGQFKKQEQEQEQEQAVQSQEYFQSPLPVEGSDPDLINWDDWHPIL